MADVEGSPIDSADQNPPPDINSEEFDRRLGETRINQAESNARQIATIEARLLQTDLPQEQRVQLEQQRAQASRDNSKVARFLSAFGIETPTIIPSPNESPASRGQLNNTRIENIPQGSMDQLRQLPPEQQLGYLAQMSEAQRQQYLDSLSEEEQKAIGDANTKKGREGFRRRMRREQGMDPNYEANYQEGLDKVMTQLMPQIMKRHGWTEAQLKAPDDDDEEGTKAAAAAAKKQFITEAANNTYLDQISGVEDIGNERRKDLYDKIAKEFQGTAFPNRDWMNSTPEKVISDAGYEIIPVMAQNGYEAEYYWPKDDNKKVALMRSMLYVIEDDLLQDSGLMQSALQELYLVLNKFAFDISPERRALGQKMLIEFRRRFSFVQAFYQYHMANNTEQVIGAVGGLSNAWFDTLIRDSSTLYDGTPAEKSNLYIGAAYRWCMNPLNAEKLFKNANRDYGSLRSEIREYIRSTYGKNPDGTEIDEETVKSSVIIATRLWEATLMRVKMERLVNKKTRVPYLLTAADPNVRFEEWEKLRHDATDSKIGVDFEGAMDKGGNDAAKNINMLWLYYRANGYNLDMELLTGADPDKTGVDFNYRDIMSLVPNEVVNQTRHRMIDALRDTIYKDDPHRETHNDELLKMADAWSLDLARAITGFEVGYLDDPEKQKHGIYDAIAKKGVMSSAHKADPKEKYLVGVDKSPYDAMGISNLNISKMAYKAQDLLNLKIEGVINDTEYKKRIAVIQAFFKVVGTDKEGKDVEDVLGVDPKQLRRIRLLPKHGETQVESDFYSKMYEMFNKDKARRTEEPVLDENSNPKMENGEPVMRQTGETVYDENGKPKYDLSLGSNLFSFEWVQEPAQRTSRFIKNPDAAVELFYKGTNAWGRMGTNAESFIKFAEHFSWLRDQRYGRQEHLIENFVRHQKVEGSYLANPRTMDFLLSRIYHELNVHDEDIEHVRKWLKENMVQYNTISEFFSYVPAGPMFLSFIWTFITGLIKTTSNPASVR